MTQVSKRSKEASPNTQAIARYLKARRGVDVNPSQIGIVADYTTSLKVSTGRSGKTYVIKVRDLKPYGWKRAKASVSQRFKRETERELRRMHLANRAIEGADDQLYDMWSRLERASTYEAADLLPRMVQLAKRGGPDGKKAASGLQKMLQSIKAHDKAAQQVSGILEGY